VSTTSDSPKTALATGGFYVEEGCCVSCGVPQMVAPELVGWTEEESPSCYWIRQPETADEVNRAIRIIREQDLGCHRYSGNDPAILKRVPREECDFFHPGRAWRYSRPGGGAGVAVRFSLMESREGEGILMRIWRSVRGRSAE
jgi:hypothetical protein